jgi:integrase
MPKKATELTDLQLRRLKPLISEKTGKPYTSLHAVGGVAGLHIQITVSESKSWILRTKIGVKRRDFGLGGYPEVGLSLARDKAREYKRKISEGIDPTLERDKIKAELIASQASQMTFKEAANKFIVMKSQEFRGPRQRVQWEQSLANHAFSIIGNLNISDIKRAHIEAILNPIWTTKTSTAVSIRTRIKRIFDWCLARGYIEGSNPAQWEGNLKELYPLPSKIKKITHFESISHKGIAKFMSNLAKREGIAARALEFTILTASRSNEVMGDKRINKLGITWQEIDFENNVWIVPAERMKAGKQHKVPLSNKAIKMIEAQPKDNALGLVFPNRDGGIPSDNFMRSVLKRMGIKCTTHGFRSTFKEWAREETNYSEELSELALSHVNTDQTRAAYARSELLEPRRKLMNDWEKYCYE